MNFPDGWNEFEGHCYLYEYPFEETWILSEEYCMIKGGHLASIHSLGEMYFVLGLSWPSMHWPWVGGSDSETEVDYSHSIHMLIHRYIYVSVFMQSINSNPDG